MKNVGEKGGKRRRRWDRRAIFLGPVGSLGREREHRTRGQQLQAASQPEYPAEYNAFAGRSGKPKKKATPENRHRLAEVLREAELRSCSSRPCHCWPASAVPEQQRVPRRPP